MKWVSSDLTHLKLKETALLFHLFCYLRSTDLSPDHSMLSGVLFFLLLYFRTAWNTQTTLKLRHTNTNTRTGNTHAAGHSFPYAPAAYCTPRYGCSISSVGKEGPDLRHRIPERASCALSSRGWSWSRLAISGTSAFRVWSLARRCDQEMAEH